MVKPISNIFGHFLPAFLTSDQVRTAFKLLEIGAGRGVFVVLVVCLGYMHRDQVVEFARS